ncbi:hypothetical protein V5L74_004631 [Enterobacter hormaechei]
MSEKGLIRCEENSEAAGIIERAIIDINIIRHLCGANDDITKVMEDSITVCAPDEAENTVTLSGWLFSDGVRTGRDNHYSGVGGQLTDSVRSEGSVGS